MSASDRHCWDERYAERRLGPVGDMTAPSIFAACADLVPNNGLALEVACGRGQAALRLAARGMQVHAVDISPVVIDQAQAVLEQSGYADRVRFAVFDLDHGLPAGPRCALLVCDNFRDARLDAPMLQRLAPGGCWPSRPRARSVRFAQAGSAHDLESCAVRSRHSRSSPKVNATAGHGSWAAAVEEERAHRAESSRRIWAAPRALPPQLLRSGSRPPCL